MGENNTAEKFANDALTSAAISGTVSIAGYSISAAYNYWNSIQPKSTITQNAGYVNPGGTGNRLGHEMAGATANSNLGGCHSTGSNPLENVEYSTKVKLQMEKVEDYQHSFPSSVDAFGNMAKERIIYDYQGSPVKQYEIEGTYRGQEGKFEYIINQRGIDHRFFRPNKE